MFHRTSLLCIPISLYPCAVFYYNSLEIVRCNLNTLEFQSQAATKLFSFFNPISSTFSARRLITP